MPHIIRSQQFSLPELSKIFSKTDMIRSLFATEDGKNYLRTRALNKTICLLFYEPSTRTRVSFDLAAKHLGMQVCSTENAKEFSSAIKGESLEDSIRVLCGYGVNVIVLRHYEEGAAYRVTTIADQCKVAIINAGDGGGQHPTQALLDLYTIQAELGSIDSKTIVIGGDLKNGRTARSLAYLVSRYEGVNLILVAPPEFQMRDDILKHLKEHSTPYRIVTDKKNLQDDLRAADVVYWTRTQLERIEGKLSANFEEFTIGPDEMAAMKERSILMHPLPRKFEIDVKVDKDPRAAYFRQATYGMFVRMALLDNMFNASVPLNSKPLSS